MILLPPYALRQRREPAMYAISHTFFRRCDAKGGNRKLRDLGKKKENELSRFGSRFPGKKVFKNAEKRFSSFMREDAFVRSGTEFMLRLFFPAADVLWTNEPPRSVTLVRRAYTQYFLACGRPPFPHISTQKKRGKVRKIARPFWLSKPPNFVFPPIRPPPHWVVAYKYFPPAAKDSGFPAYAF